MKIDNQPSGANRGLAPKDKILSLEEVGAVCARARAAGMRVVHCHGTFDLLHLGHVRHLESARNLGDLLVVTLTGDRYVNKGPGRPIFTELLRAEMLAVLAYVDYVAINPSPDAVSAITVIRPSLYVKGQDYQVPEGDVTGKIVKEREAVEQFGGEIFFTQEITFSSSSLINRHFNVYEPHVSRHLSRLRENGSGGIINDLLDKIADMKVLFVGDAIIDEYQFVVPMGKSAKENIIATRFRDKETYAGGVFAAANHLATFCRQVDIVTVLGDNDPYEPLIRNTLHEGVGLHAVRRPNTPTCVKRRFVDPSYTRKLFEVYVFDDDPLAEPVADQLYDELDARLPEYDVVVVTDFGHGMIDKRIIDLLCRKARFLAVNTQTNSANMGFNLVTKYPRADYVCIDAPEARLATCDRTSTIGDLIADQLSQRIDCGKIIVTNGRHGCVTYSTDETIHSIPALTSTVVDTVGAGDAFLSLTAPLAAAGGPMSLVGFMGNIIGALKVEIVGHRKSVDKVAVVKSLTSLLK